VQLRRPPRLQRSLIGPIVMTIGTVITLFGSFSSWLRSGTVGRSSFELLGLVHRLGFVPNGPTRMIVRSWPVMPVLLTAGVVAVWWGWRSVGAFVALVGAVYAAAVGGAVAFAAPDVRGVDLSSAPRTTVFGAAVVGLGSLLAVLVRVPSATCPPVPKPLPS
jgi:hypothetical protein